MHGVVGTAGGQMGLQLCKKGPVFGRTGELEALPQSSGHMLYFSIYCQGSVEGTDMWQRS